jgi:hypothetical protein
MKKFDLIKGESCPEEWKKMKSQDKNSSICLKCNECVTDISKLSLREISENYLGTGKCYRMSPAQLNFFQFLKKTGQYAALVAGISGISFNSNAAPMDIDSEFVQSDSTTITGIAKFKIKGRGPRKRALKKADHIIWVKVADSVYETKCDKKGNFKLVIPKGQFIESSNVAQLREKTINKEVVNLEKITITLTAFHRRITGKF